MLAFWRVLFGVALVVTCYLCLSPHVNPPAELARHDKVVHFSMFALNGLLALPAFPGSPQRWLVLAGLVLYGGSLEWLQGFVPNRDSSLADGVANSLGVMAAGVIGIWNTWRAGRARGARSRSR